MIKQKKVLNEMNFLRNIGMILVLIGHAAAVYSGRWNYELIDKSAGFLDYISDYIYTFHMPLFVFISGYIFFYQKEKFINLKILLKEKFKRLIIPYLVTGILFVIPFQEIFNVYKDQEKINIRIIRDILFAEKPGHLWYLLMLFNVFIIFFLLKKKLFKNENKNLILFSLISLGSIFIPNLWAINLAFKYLIFFYLGYSFNNVNLKRIKTKNLFFIQVIIFNLNYFILSKLTSNVILKIYYQISNLILSIIGVIIVVNLVFSLKGKLLVNFEKNKFYKCLNKYNFGIYLLHQPIMLAIIVGVEKMNINPYILFLLLIVTSINFSIVILKLKEKIYKIF